jgi:hypothetical protein
MKTRTVKRSAGNTGSGKLAREIGNSDGVRANEPRGRRAFLLVLVMLVIALASLATLSFSRSMLISNESSQISSHQLQARMCAESGVQSARLLLSYTPDQRLANGGTWMNPQFQARNVVSSPFTERRGNFSVIAPSFDQSGSYNDIRYGLQNESAKLNLNMLVELDGVLQSPGTSTGPSTSGDAGGLDSLGLGSESALPITPVAVQMLMALPGMTQDVAESILDWIDSDDTARTYGAESAYYATQQPAYKPANKPIESIEQLLLVRGVTPQLLYGYDENRNGVLDPGEANKMSLGLSPGGQPGQINAQSMDPNYVPPPPLGLAAYLTLHSQERNMARDGSPRININSDNLQQLYTDLSEALGDESWAGFIVAYRMGGRSSNPNGNPLASLTALTYPQGETDGQLDSQQEAAAQTAEAAGQLTSSVPWTPDALSGFDLSTTPKVRFMQVLDLYDAVVTSGDGQQAKIYASPFSSLPEDLSGTASILLDRLTTVDAATIGGRINLLEAPREVLLAIPGLTVDIVDQIVATRNYGVFDDARSVETWLVSEGYLTLDQLRGIQPMITCGGDVFKAQIIGYMEGRAAFSRIETIIDAAATPPGIRFYRRLDHLGRGFSIPVLGQRPDAGGIIGISGP